MNHKNIMKLLAAVFAFSIFNSLLVLFTKLPGSPEIFFTIFFSVLIITCIVFFKGKELAKNKSLFLRVSIIALLCSIFGKKK